MVHISSFSQMRISDSTALESSCASLIEVLPSLSDLALEKLVNPLWASFSSVKWDKYINAFLHIYT